MEFDDFSPLKRHHSMVHCAFLPAASYRIRRQHHPAPATQPLENTTRTHTDGRVQLLSKLVRTCIRYP